MKAEAKCCIDCQNHQVINDYDPYDWFCDDDIAVVCKITINDTKNPDSPHRADRCDFKAVTRSCRPYNGRQESAIPEWCPLIKTIEVVL